MSGHEERRVKVRHDITQVYERRRLPRGGMSISGDLEPNSNSSSDDDIEDDTYIPSPWACPYGKGLAGPSGSGSGSGTTRNEEIEEELEEESDADEEEEEETFDVEEINPTSYIHMRTPTFRIP
jgi:hypothetical protein